ncbi:MAG: hypothetical protein LBT97_03795 [Planctomycetota bacterium]|jgi:hypothetical protein|nr:hypothetical protein [Planctomycetota bacterium]
MTTGLTVTKQVHFRIGRGKRKVMREGAAPEKPKVNTVPRLSRLMALAIRMRRLVDAGQVADYADLARLAYVSRARITQIMNLLHLAPDIQEDILFLPATDGGRAPIREKMVRPIAAVPDWRKQRQMWKELNRTATP